MVYNVFFGYYRRGTSDSVSSSFPIFFDSISFLLIFQPHTTKLDYLLGATVMKEVAHPLSRRSGQKSPFGPGHERSSGEAWVSSLCGTRICVPFLHVLLISGQAQGLPLAEAYSRAHLWDAILGMVGRRIRKWLEGSRL